MSLSARKNKIVGRRPKFRFSRISTSRVSWSERFENSRTDQYRIDYGDPEQDDYYTSGTYSEIRIETGNNDRTSIEIVSENGAETRISSVKEWNVEVNGEGVDFTLAEYTTVIVGNGSVQTFHKRVVMDVITETSTSRALDDESEFEYINEDTKVDNISVSGRIYNETKTQETYSGLDLAERPIYNADETNYILSEVIDEADLLRDATAVTDKTMTMNVTRVVITNGSELVAKRDDQVMKYLVYYQLDGLLDFGDRRWKNKQKRFSSSLMRFTDVWDEIGNGQSADPEFELLAEDRPAIDEGAESETKIAYMVSAYTLSIHEDDWEGGYRLTKFEVEEDSAEIEGYLFTKDETLYNSLRIYERPALIDKGDYAKSVTMIRDLYGVPALTDYSRAREVVVNEDKSTSTSTNDSYEYHEEWSVGEPDPELEFNNIIYYTVDGNGNSSRAETRSTVVEWQNAVGEEWVTHQYGAAEVTPFPVALVQVVPTPGFRPFGEVVTEVLFNTYETRELELDYGETPEEIRFDFPFASLNGEVVRGQKKLDLSDSVYETVVTRQKVKYQRIRRGGAPEFATYEETASLTRKATVRSEWEYPEGDATTFTMATLKQIVKDSDGFVATRRVAYRLKDSIPRGEQTGHTIENPVGGWVAVGPDGDATLHFGRALLHISEVDGSGSVKEYEVSAESAKTVKIGKGRAISVRIERLWMPLGKHQGASVMTRGSLYLNS